MAVSVPALSELLRGANGRALHLELRDAYAGSLAFAAWIAGRPFDRGGADDEWRSLIGPLVARGVDVRRARIVSEPVTDYVRFLHEVTPLANLAAGEAVKWLARSNASTLALPGNDFWLVDDRVLFSHFSGVGEWVGVDLVTDPAVVAFCAKAFDDVWERGTDHEAYRPA